MITVEIGTLFTLALATLALGVMTSAAQAPAPPPEAPSTLPTLILSVDLEPDLPGVTTTLDGLNAQDQLVGSITGPTPPSGGTDTRGFLLDGLHLTLLTGPPGATRIIPKAINAAGVIVGFLSLEGRQRGFVRDAAGTVFLLDVPGATLTEPTGINEQRLIVGDYRDSAGRFHGFVQFGGFSFPVDVPFPAARDTAVSAINNVSQLTGFWSDTAHTLRGFLLGSTGFEEIVVPGATLTLPVDINDGGDIVGVYADAAGMLRSFLRTADGQFQRLDVPFAGVRATDVAGITNARHLVGSYVVEVPGSGTPAERHGFVTTGLLPRTPLTAEAVAFESAQAEAEPGLTLARSGCVDGQVPEGSVLPSALQGLALFCAATP